MQEKSFVDTKPILGFRFGEFFTSPRVRPDGVLSSVLLWGYSFGFSCTERTRIVFSGGFCFSLHHLFLYACYLSWLLSLDFCCPSYIFLFEMLFLCYHNSSLPIVKWRKCLICRIMTEPSVTVVLYLYLSFNIMCNNTE